MIRTTLLSALAALGLTGQIATAQDFDQHVVSLEVLPGWRSADGTHIAALRIELAPGWKTYWRAPGDAGIPPLINWSGSDNLAKFMPVWPTPEVFSQNGMTSVGYEDALVLPIVLTPKDRAKPIALSGELQIGICKDVCVPADIGFKAALPLDKLRDATISAALTDQPYSAQMAGVGRISCDISLTEDGLALSATVQMPSAGAHEYTVVETSDPEIWVAEAETTRIGNTLSVRTEMIHMTEDSFALDRSGLRLTVLGSDHAVDIQGCPAS
ncbi:MAG: protein-disulfide reductase DsbD domain-containing protein [Thalassovita sp.]